MIRHAVPADSPAAVPLIILAMDQIALSFANVDKPEEAVPFFKSFFETEGNQYGYQNTLVFEEDAEIVGLILGYDGGKLHELRQPVLKEIRKSQPDYTLSNETEAGEFYIDCLAVSQEHHGKGIAKKLIRALCDHAASLGYKKVGLIVDQVNPKARKLYEDVGFQVFGEKDFVGHRYDHMVREVL
ncbi:GNAT family N-acetyltransferase [Dyadobacter luticola]|uniref:GNAT family N-acetyltransferase n=1 Tax=Dyadobacter luticola TaxID=1979387 RepID=A0A5R9KWN0_9BACT|nr:GNAT family N-acetyltransferase [Dyadobacter luticola]TLV00497.1 GNAT family N-acetyltransferase [Dyadobacter luticola]